MEVIRNFCGVLGQGGMVVSMLSVAQKCSLLALLLSSQAALSGLPYCRRLDCAWVAQWLERPPPVREVTSSNLVPGTWPKASLLLPPFPGLPWMADWWGGRLRG